MKKGYLLCNAGKNLNITNKNIEGLFEEPHLSTVEYLNITEVAHEVEIDYSCFRNLKRLMISSLEPYTFPKEICFLANLENITCSGCCLIPQEIGEMKALKTLNINGDCVMNMPESIENVTSLESLQIAYYDAPSCPMPIWITRMRQLKQLILFLCYFTKIDASINNLVNLRELHIVGALSAASDFPSLSGLQNLERLIISGEGYPSLPKPPYKLFPKVLDGISELRNLKYLSLEGWRSRKKADYMIVTEQGRSIPDVFDKYQNLEDLNLFGMKIDFLPQSLYQLSKLKRMIIGDNNLSTECLQRLANTNIKIREY